MSSSAEDSSSTIPKKDDSFLAISILLIAVIVVVVGIIYSWRSSRKTDRISTASSSFNYPPERENFIKAKENLNPLLPSELEELKKLLMKRALQIIPMLLNYQNEGHSIERLYKRGMLTDDMHYKVKELKDFFDQEFQDVKNEADELVTGWGSTIWEQANYFNQMIIQKNEEKAQGVRAAEDEKKKLSNEKRREKEKAKKLALKEANNLNNNNSKAEIVKEKDFDIIETDPEVLKAQEAEKMAKQLIEEEEEQSRQRGGGQKKTQQSKTSKK